MRRLGGNVAAAGLMVAAAGLIVAVAGCTPQQQQQEQQGQQQGGGQRGAAPNTGRQVAACISPDGRSGKIDLEFRRGESVVASGRVDAGAVFRSPVPVNAHIEVFADGKLIGSSESGDVYLHGPGCPDKAR